MNNLVIALNQLIVYRSSTYQRGRLSILRQVTFNHSRTAWALIDTRQSHQFPSQHEIPDREFIHSSG